ncbi:hypothetical protein AAZX31_02G051100 [Glycine max]
MNMHLEVGAKSGREESKESRSSNFESEYIIYAALSSHNQSPAIADSDKKHTNDMVTMVNLVFSLDIRSDKISW